MTELTELIRTERVAFIDLLESLTEDQWQTPSLCTAWTVENVAAHLAWAPVSGPVEMVPAAVRVGFRPNRLIADAAVRWTARGRPAMFDQLRRNVGCDARPLGLPPVAALTDAVVHGLDVRLPLGLHRDVDPEAFRLIADWTATLRWPMTVPVGGNVRKRLRGTRLVAIDADWAWGEGAEVRERTDMILLRLLARDRVPR
ncbi:MAG TPA: maleylpyruvate isomerase family mycothiol-dependent enzyme [Microlunatus sp.]|nr:maleylpyruvate isomerase family mycothiol-dependent enzyme [Microlunatus sp.]